MTVHRPSRRLVAIVFVVSLVFTVTMLAASPAYAVEGEVPPATPTIDPTALVVALVMATVEALKRYAKFPTDLIWLPVVILGVAFNIGYAVVFAGATGAAITEAAKMGLWLGVEAAGLFSLFKAATKRPTPSVPPDAPTPTPTE